MGAYLSHAITEKLSSDEINQFLSCGSSSMQGWRISQEDAHNCLLDFDEKTSFFSVYDGHGGAEVAAYCAQKLPEFLKQLESYKNGNYEEALKEAFLGFDATLLEQKVIDVLKNLAKRNPDEGGTTTEEEDDDENIADLCSEASMPLEAVLEKYKGTKANPNIDKLKEGNSSKPLSPFLRGKRNAGNDEGAGGSGSSSGSPRKTNNSAAAAASSSGGSGSSKKVLSMDDQVSSSSMKADTASVKADGKAEPCSSSADNEVNHSKKEKAEVKSDVNVPDISSSSTKAAEKLSSPKSEQKVSDAKVKASETAAVNGDLSGSAKEVATSNATPSTTAATKSDVSSSCSSSAGSAKKQENGEISSAVGSAAASGSPAAKKPTTNSISSTNIKIPDGLVKKDEDDDDDDDDSSVDDEEYNENEQSSEEEGEDDEDMDEEDTEEEDAGDEMNEEDEEFINNMVDEPGKDSGCTAVVALLCGKDLYVANAGDSRCVVCRKGEALEMSFDHKPEDDIERERITKAGGRVTLDGRVNGGLNLSRAIGDHGYKMNKALKPQEQMISALPDIKKVTITPEDEFMVLACDGIWNFMTSEDVVAFVKERIDKDKTKPMSKICEEMFEACLAPNTMGDGTGCDNMTAIIVQFKPTFTSNGTDEAVPSRKRTVSLTDSSTTNGVEEESKRPKLDTDEKSSAAATIAEPEPSVVAAVAAESGISSSS